MKTIKDEGRLSLRPVMQHEETSQERAARRIAELRDHNNANVDEGTDKFATPIPPDGWSYEWKVKSVLGYVDAAYLQKMARSGWEPVDVSRHPDMLARGAVGAIERDGMVLCERPAEITNEIKARDLRNARAQVRMKEGQLDPKGKGGLISREDAQVAPKMSILHADPPPLRWIDHKSCFTIAPLRDDGNSLKGESRHGQYLCALRFLAISGWRRRRSNVRPVNPQNRIRQHHSSLHWRPSNACH